MKYLEAETTRTPSPTAEFYRPQRFGFTEVEPDRHWQKEIGGQRVDFLALDWYDHDLLPGMVQLQKEVWGMDPVDVVPLNTLAIARKTGGGVIGAYSPEGELIGGALWFGSNTPLAVSHMVGVVKERRYSGGLGHNLKLLQAFMVAQDSYQGMFWTYDPLRGANARLNIEKLGAVVWVFKINVYGSTLRSAEYGTADTEMPTDRFVALWDLSDPTVQQRVSAYYHHTYLPLHPSDCDDLPLVVARRIGDTGYRFEVEYPEEAYQLRVAIPPDIDAVNKKPQLKRDWLFGTRAIFTRLLTTHHGRGEITNGGYVVTGFATGKVGPDQDRESYYVSSHRSLFDG
jgi:predicted GNAT superfamily acetyltransferase